MKNISNNQKSLAGEFAALSQLALRGYDANITLGNTKNVDILLSNPKTGKMLRLEVKTTLTQPKTSKLFGKTFTWMQMKEKHENIKANGLFYCFVYINIETSEYRFFIVPSNIVADYVKREHVYWMEAKSTHKENSMRSFRLGFPSENYKFSRTIFTDEYENKWDLLR